MSPPPTDGVSRNDRMQALELRAGAVRARLLRVVDALDRRRHQAVAVGRYAKAIARPAAMSMLGIVVVVGVGALAIRHAFRARRAGWLSARASRAIQRLDLVPKPSVGARILEKAVASLLTLATELLTQLTKVDKATRIRLALPEGNPSSR